MIIVMKHNASEAEINAIAASVRSLRYEPRIIRGVERTVIACVGDELENRSLEALKDLPSVDAVMPVQKRHKLCSREYHAEDTVVTVGGQKIGGGDIAIIAGPCAVESHEQFRTAVSDLTRVGVRVIRGMAYKPRTSPYDFQGLREEGLEIIRAVRKEFGIAVVSEILDAAHIPGLVSTVDMLQVGARNAQNYSLLEAVAKTGLPVLLKRGMSSTVEEWLGAAEYLMVNGCSQIVLCERGLRSFDRSVRNLLDLGAVAVAKAETHLPVIVDPSHAAGKQSLVRPLSLAALGAGADGLVVEAHPRPMEAYSDAGQQLETAKFGEFLASLAPWMELAVREKKMVKVRG